MNQDNVLVRDGNAAAVGAPEQGVKTLPGLYPLDWKTADVKLGKGKFSHIIRRPATEELIEFDRELQTPIEIGKDGSYKLPDPTASEKDNVRLYDKLIESTDGYKGDVPAAHKSAVITGHYRREIYLDDEADIFADEVTVFEEIGGDPPAFTIQHTFRQPTEEELRAYRRKMQTGEMKPGKRGRQEFVTRSNLKTAMDYYDKWIVGVDGATVGGQPLGPAMACDSVDPLIKRMVVQSFVTALTEGLLD